MWLMVCLFEPCNTQKNLALVEDGPEGQERSISLPCSWFEKVSESLHRSQDRKKKKSRCLKIQV